MKKGFTLFELLIVIAIIWIVILTIVDIKNAHNRKGLGTPTDYCEMYRNKPLAQLPVDCYGYFHLDFKR